MLTLDEYIKGEVRNIINSTDVNDVNFFNLFKYISLTEDTLGKKHINTNNYSAIKENIKETVNEKVKISKCIVLGFYKYMIANNQDDIDITNKIYNFIIATDKQSELITLRDILPIRIDHNKINSDVEDCFSDFSEFNINNLYDIKEALKFKLKNLINNKDNFETSFANIGIYTGILVLLNFIILFIIIKIINNCNKDKKNISDKDGNFKFLTSIYSGFIYIFTYMYTKANEIAESAESVRNKYKVGNEFSIL
jgi:hypothetical protein